MLRGIGIPGEKEETWEKNCFFRCFLFLKVGGEGLGNLFSPADKSLDAFLELAAWQQHTMVAPTAFEANVSSQAYYPPFITATRVWFSQAYHITQPDLHDHRSTISLLLDKPRHYITTRLLWLIGELWPLHALSPTAKAPKFAKIVTLCYSCERRLRLLRFQSYTAGNMSELWQAFN